MKIPLWCKAFVLGISYVSGDIHKRKPCYILDQKTLKIFIARIPITLSVLYET